MSKDTSPLYIRIGPLQGNLSYSNLQIPESGVFEAADIVETLDRIGTLALHNSSWSLVVYDYKSTHIAHTNHVLASSGANIIDKSGNTKYTKHDRTYQVQLRHLCSNISAITATTSAENANMTSSISMEKKCVDLLQDLRNEGKKHWDAQVIVIDMHPPNNSSSHSKPTKNSSQLTRDSDTAAKSQLTNKSQLASKSELTSKRQLASKSQSTKTFKSSSLRILLNLDLNYLRPKLIFVRMAIINYSAILLVEPVFSNNTKNCSISDIDDLYIADQFLTRHGYITDHQLGPSCGNHSGRSSSSSSSRTGPGDHRIAQYACLWGSRINELEFLPDLK